MRRLGLWFHTKNAKIGATNSFALKKGPQHPVVVLFASGKKKKGGYINANVESPHVYCLLFASGYPFSICPTTFTIWFSYKDSDHIILKRKTCLHQYIEIASIDYLFVDKLAFREPRQVHPGKSELTTKCHSEARRYPIML